MLLRIEAVGANAAFTRAVQIFKCIHSLADLNKAFPSTVSQNSAALLLRRAKLSDLLIEDTGEGVNRR